MALQGFDKNYYLQAKLDALVASGETEWVGKDAAFLETVLVNVYGLTPEDHYSQYGYAEGLAPNACFNAAEYSLAKATQLFDSGHYMSIEDALADYEAKWPGDDYQHYLQYGSAEGINPSNAFDESSYLDSKLAALQADPATSAEWADKTADDVHAAFTAASLTVLGHYIAYGQDEGIEITAVPTDEQVDVDTSVPGIPGEIFTLTTNSDIIIGTDGDDTIYGLDTASLTSADIIDGGAGSDILIADFSDDDYAPVITGVETIQLRAANYELDLIDSDGYTDLVVERDDGDSSMSFVNINNIVDITLSDLDDDSDMDFYFDTGVLAGDNDTVTINMIDVTDGDDIIGLYGEDSKGEGVENVVLNSTVTDASLVNDPEDLHVFTDDGQDIADGSLETLTIIGDGNIDSIDVSGWIADADGDRTAVVDASAFTGDIDIDFNLDGDDTLTYTGGSGADTVDVDSENGTVHGGDGDDDLDSSSGDIAYFGDAGDDTIAIGTGDDTVDGGSGDDFIAVAANLDENDAIDGGSGTDTLETTSVYAATIEADADILAVIDDIEELAISDALTTNLDLTTWGIGTLNLETADASAGVISMESGDTIKITDDDGTTGAVDALVDGASDAGSSDDVVNIVFTADYSGGDIVNVADMSVDFVETVNLTVTDTDDDSISTGTMTLSMTDADRVDTINVTSDQITVVEGDDFAALNTVDASASTGGLTINVSGATQGVVITGGSGDDDITGSDFADIISTGEGDDTIVGSTGADQLTGGADADTFTFAADTSVEGLMTAISDFSAVEDDDEADTLDTVSDLIEADSAADTDVSGADVDSGVITANITDGIITLGGADSANIDTLAEWIDVAEIMVAVDAGVAGAVAFEFNSNTYVLEAGVDDLTDSIVELTGVTGITALDTAEATDTILIA